MQKPIQKVSKKKAEEIRDACNIKKSMLHDQYLTYGHNYCENCLKRSPIIDMHHIVHQSRVSKHPEKNNIKNLILLCRVCHNWIHSTTEGKFQDEEWIHERSLDILFNLKTK